VATLVRYTRLSERTVRTCLDRLAEAGIIREGDPDIVAAKIKRGDRRPQNWDLAMELVRDDLTDEDLITLERIYPGITDRVENARERGATDAPRSKPGDMNGVQLTHERGAAAAPEPYIEPSSNKRKSTNVLFRSDRRRPASRSDASRPSSKISARGRRASADDDIDPAKAVADAPPDPEPKRRADSSLSLVAYFYDRLKSTDTGARAIMTIPDPVNKRQMSIAFTRWKRDGITPDRIRAMIDAYAPDDGALRLRIPPWKDFLAQRAGLSTAVTEQKINDPTTQEFLDYWGPAAGVAPLLEN